MSGWSKALSSLFFGTMYLAAWFIVFGFIVAFIKMLWSWIT